MPAPGIQVCEEHVVAARAVWSDRSDEIKVARATWFTAYKSLHAADAEVSRRQGARERVLRRTDCGQEQAGSGGAGYTGAVVGSAQSGPARPRWAESPCGFGEKPGLAGLGAGAYTSAALCGAASRRAGGRAGAVDEGMAEKFRAQFKLLGELVKGKDQKKMRIALA